MAYLVFARKYRPQAFEDVVEQSHVTQTLANAVTSGRLAHAILFSGPRGTGKTTIARILAKCVNCEEGPTAIPCNKCRSCIEIAGGNTLDVFEIDGASNNRVENVRELRENAKYMPAHSPYKIYIVDEVHMLSDSAFNALLKILEEPPAHVLFVFATTEVQKIPVTILSRCQRYDLRRISIDSIVGHMEKICNGEKIDISEKGLALIALEADGSIRDALSLLEQIITCSDEAITDQQVIDVLGVINRQVLFDISGALFSGDMAKILEICDLLYRQGRHLVKFYAQLIEHFRNLMIIKMDETQTSLYGVASHELAVMKQQVDTVTQPYLYQVLNILFEEEWRVKHTVSPKLALEMTFFRILQVKPAFSFDELIEKLDRIKSGVKPGATQDEPSGPGPGHTFGPLSDAEPAKEHHSGPVKNTKPADEAKNSIAEAPAGEFEKAQKPKDPKEMDDTEIWERLRSSIYSASPALGACLAEGTVKYTPPDELVIEITSTNANVNLLNRKKNIAAIEKHCNDFFKKQMKVTIDAKQAVQNRGEKKNRRQQLENEAMNHPLVNAAVRTFSGKILDIKFL